MSDEPSVRSWNPQKKAIEPVTKRRGRYKFEPGKGMVPAEDDMDPEFEIDVNEAIADSQAARERRSVANLGYATLKKGRS